MLSHRTVILALCAVFWHPIAGAAEPWESAPFTTPASELLQAASAIKRERATNVVVMLDERVFEI